MDGTSVGLTPSNAMKNKILLVSLLSSITFGAAQAQELTAEAVNNANIAAVPPEPVQQQEKPAPDPAIIHLQVLLDRAGASPGVIDGLDGNNVRKAVAGFEALQSLPVDGKVDPDVVTRLADDQHVVGPYQIDPDDAADIVAEIPKDYAEQAKMEHLGFTSVAEKLAERFHMDVDLVRALNPSAKFEAGETILVANIGAPRAGVVKRIEARRKEGQLVAYDDQDAIIAVYPATIGSEDNPSPSGKHKVNGVARNPTYEYNPKINFQQGQNKSKLTLPSGANNPVGTVWIDLSEPTYGIHGTPEPSLIDKAGSHGCVRLTNWDAEELASMVKPGVMVEFED